LNAFYSFEIDDYDGFGIVPFGRPVSIMPTLYHVLISLSGHLLLLLLKERIIYPKEWWVCSELISLTMTAISSPFHLYETRRTVGDNSGVGAS
jgi:hypothetical protein